MGGAVPLFRKTRASRVDEAFDSWVAWRAACGRVDEAYRRWAIAPRAQRALAFASYRAALDLEEESANRHAAI
jgi:hypothetical protein